MRRHWWIPIVAATAAAGAALVSHASAMTGEVAPGTASEPADRLLEPAGAGGQTPALPRAAGSTEVFDPAA
jgi:hypothetical protein